MALLTPGFWPSTFWPSSYWVDDYWPDHGAPVIPDYLPAIDEMAYSEYQTVGTWRMDRVKYDAQARFSLVDPIRRSDIDLPTESWTRDEFPAIHEDSEGEPKAIIYGEVLRVPCICVNTTTREFRCAGHAISAFRSVYVDGEEIDTTDESLANAGFVYAAWSSSQSVTADVLGYNLTNPADVIEDVLTTYAGVPAAGLDATSFATSREGWKAGVNAYTLAEVHQPAIGIHISDESVSEIIERIMEAAQALVYIGRTGLWTCKAWGPVVGEGLPWFRDADVFGLTVEEDSRKPITRVQARYAERIEGGAHRVETYSNDEWKIRRGLTEHNTYSPEIPISEEVDSEDFVSRLVRQRGVQKKSYLVSVNQRAATLEPGDFIRVTYSPRDVDKVLEVIEIDHDPTSGQVDLVCSNVRGMDDQPGFFTDDPPALPSRLGGGIITAWTAATTAAQQTWVKENLGFWTDDDGYSDAGQDPDGHNITVWS